MARKEDHQISVLLVNPDTPTQRAARVVPTRLLPMLGDRAVLLTRAKNPDAVLAWAHRDTLLSTVTMEPVA